MTFRRLLFSLLAFACTGTAVCAQTSTDPNESSQLSQDPSTGAYSFSWWGHAGRTYFLQQSDNLLNWSYLPVIESGANQVIQWDATSNQPRFFMRLESTDQPTSNPYGDDFNGDGLSNWQNLLQGSDPLGPVSFDANGLPINWELFYNVPAGTDPNALAPRGDGLTYLQAFQQRLDPNDFYNGSVPGVVLVDGGDQRGDPDTVLPSPVTVLVTADPQGQGDGLLNAPVTFTVTSGGALLSASADGSGLESGAGIQMLPSGLEPSTSVQVRTSAQFVNGVMQNVALVYVYLPATANDLSVITVSATTAGQTASVATTATSDDPTLPPPSGLSAVALSSTAVQLTWTPGDSARATTIQISLDGGVTWRTVGTVAAGVLQAKVTGLPVHVRAAFRLLTAPGAAGTPADPGGDGVTTLTLPANPALLPSGGGIGSANTDASFVQTLGAVRVRSESYFTSQVWPLPQAPYGLVNHSLKDNCYLSCHITYNETHTASGLLSYDKSYTATTQFNSPVLTGTHTVSPASAEGYQPNFYGGFVGNNPWIDYSKVLFWNPSVYFNGHPVGEVITNETYSLKGSSHTDAVYDEAGNLVSPADDSTDEWTCTVSQPVKFDDLGPLTESRISLGTGPLPGNAFPADQFYGWSFAIRAIGQGAVLTGDDPAFGSVFGLGRFQWQVDSGSNQTVYWDEQFTPFIDTPNPNAAPWPGPVQHDIHTWQSQGATESPIYVVDPRTRHNGQYGRYDVVYLDVDLVPDYDHNHVIDDEDRNKATTDHPFRFWINDDNDSGDTGGDDIPSIGTSGRNCDDYTINGARDLVDFFPVYLNIAPLVQQFPPATYTYYLRQSDAALNFIATDLTADHAGDYLTNIGAADAILNSTTDPDAGVSYAGVTSIVAEGRGTALDVEFINKITSGSKKGIILVEAKRATTSPLILTVVSKADTSKSIISLQMPLSISPVEQMFRHKNLRAAAGGSGGADDRLNEPQNLPDAETNGKWFVFLHGYNVPIDGARGWYAEMFKRLFWSGSKAKFCGVSWRGEETQASTRAGYVTPNFHKNVNNALMTAHPYANFLTTLTGEVTTAAHSLGNVVALSAMSDWGAQPARHYMIDAAVTMEALDQSLNTDNYMVHEDWRATYYFGLRACEWWRLFSSSDARSTLTWRDRFQAATNSDLYNFYSSSEDVLAAYDLDGDPGLYDYNRLPGARYAWSLQELLKGRMNPPNWVNTFMNGGLGGNANPPYNGPVAGSTYGGWGFNTDYDTSDGNHMDPAQAENLSVTALMSKPFFSPRFVLPDNGQSAAYTPTWLADLFDPSKGSGVAAANRNQLLAEMIPARVLPAGANFVSALDENNFDMPTIFKTDKSHPVNWPVGQGRWLHSSFREVAYLYVYKLYNEFVEVGGLDQ